MNDQRKTKKQLLEELELERERSQALQEVSKRVAAAHDTDEVLDLIVNEAARLLSAPAAFLRLLCGPWVQISPTLACAGVDLDPWTLLSVVSWCVLFGVSGLVLHVHRQMCWIQAALVLLLLVNSAFVTSTFVALPRTGRN